MNFLKPDSPLMRALSVLADLMILNILTLLLCIPVITAGAAFTAMHYVLLKMVRNREGYIVRSFFKAFKQNFLQATVLWILTANAAVVLAVDWMYLRAWEGSLRIPLMVLLSALTLFIFLIVIYIFPVLSRYQNTVLGTVKTAFSLSTSGIKSFRTILAALLAFTPFLFAWYCPFGLIPLLVVFCFAVPGFLRAKLYSEQFEKLEAAKGLGSKPEDDPD